MEVASCEKRDGDVVADPDAAEVTALLGVAHPSQAVGMLLPVGGLVPLTISLLESKLGGSGIVECDVGRIVARSGLLALTLPVNHFENPLVTDGDSMPRLGSLESVFRYRLSLSLSMWSLLLALSSISSSFFR